MPGNQLISDLIRFLESVEWDEQESWRQYRLGLAYEAANDGTPPERPVRLDWLGTNCPVCGSDT